MPAPSARLLAFAGFFVVTASLIPVRAEAQVGYRDPRNADVDVAGARTARIEAGAGSLRIEGRQGLTQVRVRGTARSSHRDRLDDIKLTAERRGGEVFIKVDIPNENRSWISFGNFFMALDLVIEVPMNLSLDVADGSGEAHFINTGKLELEDGSGEIEVRGARGDVSINDGSGEILLRGVDGSVRINDGSGEIDASDVTGDFIVEEDGSGDINVVGVGGTLTIDDDGSGSIDVGRVAGDFVVRSDGGGSIRYDTVKGAVRIPERKRRG